MRSMSRPVAGRHQNTLPTRQGHPGVRDMRGLLSPSQIAKAG